jgi:hypothetical protein
MDAAVIFLSSLLAVNPNGQFFLVLPLLYSVSDMTLAFYSVIKLKFICHPCPALQLNIEDFPATDSL